MPRCRLSFSTPPVYNHEGQNDVVQHIHSCRSNIKSRFLLLGNVVWVVEFGNNSIAVNSHQLVRRVVHEDVANGGSVTDPHLWNVRPHRTQCPPVVDAVRSSKCEAPEGQTRISIPYCCRHDTRLGENRLTLSICHTWARAPLDWLSFLGK